MSLFGSKPLYFLIRYLLFICLVLVTGSVGAIAGLAQEKIPTSLTISALPVDPTINQSFHISGTLTTAGGEILGNKRILLDSSEKNREDNDSYSSIDMVVTDRNGRYEFLRSIGSPPEYLRVRFIGTDDYASCMSPVIAARGIGTDHAQIRKGGTGNIMISTNPEGAEIYINNTLRGVTPNKVAGLKEGPYIVNLSKEGYQNETMEAYVTADRDVSFDISLSDGSNVKSGGSALFDLTPGVYESSHLAYTKTGSNTSAGPDVAIDVGSGVIKTSGNDVSGSSYIHLNNSSETSPKTNTYKNLKVSTIVTNNTLGDGYDVMVIMTDH
ncbi:MAG TPA: PEGA domain-containing protein [Methanospirillum sp.]|uniref:PEGA domain-containing protein n=1 Tax=Methanospirillum sp. TaxID=45200 RepID=UPI002C73F0A0|nr:PEGA domain-containing protein [Methanospirillum sp.]HWQ64215.1 PEGA domain-containing protein [Methanospirillum sp.]